MFVTHFLGYEAVPEVSRKPADVDDIEFRRRLVVAPSCLDDKLTCLNRRERNLRDYDRTDIGFTHRRDSSSPRRHEDEIHISHRSGRKASDNDRPREIMVVRDRENKRDSMSDVREEAAYYGRIATEGAPMGEAYNGHTRDWTIVDVPPGTKRVAMDGIGGASQEIFWQRYNGVRRSKFIPSSDEYESEPQPSSSQGNVARRYVGIKDKREELWTEITKDLVCKEAIEKAGYEYEETEHFYYVFAYLRYVSRLIRKTPLLPVANSPDLIHRKTCPTSCDTQTNSAALDVIGSVRYNANDLHWNPHLVMPCLLLNLPRRSSLTEPPRDRWITNGCMNVKSSRMRFVDLRNGLTLSNGDSFSFIVNWLQALFCCFQIGWRSDVSLGCLFLIYLVYRCNQHDRYDLMMMTMITVGRWLELPAGGSEF